MGNNTPVAKYTTKEKGTNQRQSVVLAVFFIVFGCCGFAYSAIWLLPQIISLPMELNDGKSLIFTSWATAAYSVSTIITAAMGLIIVRRHGQTDSGSKLKFLHLLSCAALLACILIMIKSTFIYNLTLILGIIPIGVLLLVYTASYGFPKFKGQLSWKALLTGIMLVLVPVFLFTGYTMYSYLDISIQEDRYSQSSDFKKFEAECLDGMKINQDFFKDHKLTMVNCWETTCGPCIGEMPSLQKIYEERDGSDFTVIGICYDCASAGRINESILSDAKAILGDEITYPVLIPTAELDRGILSGITAFPTTFFVDSKGNVIKTVMGANEKEKWEEIIDECLEIAETDQ